jgi:succinyl-diaminopimelate desuccinylase
MKLKYDEHPLLGKPTINLGEIHGGAAPNIVPGDCLIYLDIRSIPGQTQNGIIGEFEKLAREVADDFTIEVQSASEPHAIKPDNILVQKIQENAQQVMGFQPEPFGMGGGTFAKTLNLCNIAAVGYGPGDDEAFHVANERVEIKQLVDFACLISMISLDLLS